MKSDDKSIRWVEEPPLGLAGRSYLPLLVGGMTTTLKHLVGPKMTVESPEQRHAIVDPLGYRGVHRLNRDAQGRVKCVACFLLRDGLSGTLHRHPGRREPLAGPRKIPGELHNRRAAVYFLRDVRGSLPGRRD